MTEAPALGEELSRARAAVGLSVADVAQQLKFAPRQIEALEQGRFEQLPAGTYARGMVRSYARLLKLDAAPLLARVPAQAPTPDAAAQVPSVRKTIPIVDSAKRTNLAYVALSLAILAVVAVVVLEWQHERSRAARLTFVPAAQAPLQPERSAMASSVPAPPLTPAAPSKSAEPRAAAEGSKRRVVLRFERESWVQVRERGGRVLTSQLNPAGSERTVEGEPPFALVIGNAQHVRVSYEDRSIDLSPHVKVEVARFILE